MSQDFVREAFEEWAAEEAEIRGCGETIGLMRDEHHDRYAMIWTQVAWVAWQAALNAPVPPTGREVEVLGMREVMIAYENANAVHLAGTSNFCAVMAKHLNKSVGAKVTRLQAENAQLVADCWTACGGNGPATRDDLLAALRIMNEAEDELTAERDALKDEAERLKYLLGEKITQHDSEMLQRIDSQSELTKARELLVAAETWMPEDGKVLADIQAFIAHQSAPAVPRCDNCGYTEKDCREQMDHYLCGLPDPAPAAKEGE